VPPLFEHCCHICSVVHKVPPPARPWIVPVRERRERDGRPSALLHPHASAVVPEPITGQKRVEWEKHTDGVEKHTDGVEKHTDGVESCPGWS